MSKSAAPTKLPAFGAVASALALYAFCRAYIHGIALIGGPLYELLRGHPRLTALVTLAIWLAPIPLIAIGHATLSGVLDRFDHEHRARGERGGAWVGLYSWLVALFSTVTTFFVVLVMQPAPPEPDLLGQLTTSMSLQGTSFAIHTTVWIVIAALLYRAEASARCRR